MSSSFDPDYVVAPGETLRACLGDLGISVRIAAKLGNMECVEFEGVLAGRVEITEAIARKLWVITLVSPRMWLALEHNFRVGLAAGKHWSGGEA